MGIKNAHLCKYSKIIMGVNINIKSSLLDLGALQNNLKISLESCLIQN